MQTGQSDAINAKDRATNSRRIFSLRTHPIHTMGHKTHVLLHFRIVWVHLGSFRYCTKFGAKWAELGQWMKSLCHEVALEFFPMNAPNTHQGTQSSCFVAFRNVWMHLGSFRYCNKLGAKWAELVQLMQKFLPRSRVGTFRYECTRYTPWDTETIFCSIS